MRRLGLITGLMGAGLALACALPSLAAETAANVTAAVAAVPVPVAAA